MSEIERQVRMGAKLLGVQIWTPLNKAHPYSLRAPNHMMFGINMRPSVEFFCWDYALTALQTLKPWGMVQHMGEILDTLEKVLVMRSTDVGD